MRTRHQHQLRAGAITATLALGLAGCAARTPGATGSSPERSGASERSAREPATQEPDAATATDLDDLLLELADLPTSGWRQMPRAEAPAGSADAPQEEGSGPCFLDLTGVGPEFDRADHAEQVFIGELSETRLTHDVIRVDDSDAVLGDLEEALRGCEGVYERTDPGDRITVVSEPVALPGHLATRALCRSYRMGFEPVTMSGHMCFAAAPRTLVIVSTMGSIAGEVPGEEVAAVLEAALDKADRT